MENKLNFYEFCFDYLKSKTQVDFRGGKKIHLNRIARVGIIPYLDFGFTFTDIATDVKLDALFAPAQKYDEATKHYVYDFEASPKFYDLDWNELTETEYLHRVDQFLDITEF